MEKLYEEQSHLHRKAFVDFFVRHLNKLGITVFFLGDKNFDDYVKINQGLLDNIHVFVIGSRSREKDIKTQHEDGEIFLKID